MIHGDKLILLKTECANRHFIYDGAVSDDRIIAVLFDDGKAIAVDLAPQAKNVLVKGAFPCVFTAFYDLDEQLSGLAA